MTVVSRLLATTACGVLISTVQASPYGSPDDYSYGYSDPDTQIYSEATTTPYGLPESYNYGYALEPSTLSYYGPPSSSYQPPGGYYYSNGYYYPEPTPSTNLPYGSPYGPPPEQDYTEAPPSDGPPGYPYGYPESPSPTYPTPVAYGPPGYGYYSALSTATYGSPTSSVDSYPVAASMNYGNVGMTYTSEPMPTPWYPITSTRTKHVTVSGCNPEPDGIITVFGKRQSTTSGQDTANVGTDDNISIVGGDNAAAVEKLNTIQVFGGSKGESSEISSTPVTNVDDVNVTGNTGLTDETSIDVVSGSNSEEGQVAASHPTGAIIPIISSDNSAALGENTNPSGPIIPVISNDPSEMVYTTLTKTTTVPCTEIYAGASQPTSPASPPSNPPSNPPSDNPAQQCGDGFVYVVIDFDEYFDRSGKVVTTGTFTPQDPFSSKDFYFTKGWELLLCENVDGERDQACTPDTVGGNHYIAIDSPASDSAVSRRISYKIHSEDVIAWQILGFFASTFPINDEMDSITTCIWTVADAQNTTPSYCKTQTLSAPNNILQYIDLVGESDVQVAYIEVSACKGSNSNSIKPRDININGFEDGNGDDFASGQPSIEFTLDNIAVCIPTDWS